MLHRRKPLPRRPRAGAAGCAAPRWRRRRISCAPSSPRTTGPASTAGGSSRAFRPSRTATCTTGTRSRSSSISDSPPRTAAAATCASTTPIRSRKTSSSRTRSPSRGALAGLRLGPAPLSRVRLLRPALHASPSGSSAQGLAYVDSQSAAEVRASRGTLTAAGRPRAPTATAASPRTSIFSGGCGQASSPTARTCCGSGSTWRARTSTCATRRSTGSATPRTTAPASTWCIYPLYDYTHCISDALEHITHSICTLEFQDHRPLYDWVIEKLADGGQLARPLPQQFEFARLNLTYVVLSKRKLIELVAQPPRRRLGRSADADAGRRAPARVHARGLPPFRRADRRVEGRLVDRHERARGLHARGPQRAARSGASPCSTR